MRLRYEQPANEDDFVLLCIRLLQRHWNSPSLQRYGRRGQKQRGVDILDTSAAKGVRGAQCKHREPWTTLTAEDIEEIVQAAKEFEPQLNHLLILTSAKRDTASQDAVLQINRAHKENGLFEVELKAWGDIEDLLDQYGDTKSVGGVDLEIDEAKTLLKDHRYREARLLLERIRSHHWAELSNWQRFRVLANLGASYQGEAKYEEAAKLFFEAKHWQPEEEKALANEAAAYLLLNKRRKAFELAEGLRQRFPQSAQVFAVWLGSAPESYSPSELEAAIPQELAGDPQVVLALGYRALECRDFESAARLGKTASEVSPDSAPAWLLRGQATIRLEFNRLRPAGMDTSGALNRDLARDAEESLSKAVELSRKNGLTTLLCQVLIERGELRNLIGDKAGRAEDIQEAYAKAPGDFQVAWAYAGLLLSSGECHRAVEMLRKLKGHGHADHVDPLLAAALRDRHQEGDAREAGLLFAEVAARQSASPQAMRGFYLQCSIQCLGSIPDWETARAVLKDLPDGLVSPSLLLTLRGCILEGTGDRSGAVGLARQALDLASPAAPVEDSRLLASLCHRLGLHEECLGVVNRIRKSGDVGEDSLLMLECLSRLERHKEALDLCAELRETGVEDPRVLEYEAHLLEVYDPGQAIQLLQDRIARHPDDKQARLRLALIGLREGRKDLAMASVEDLPPVEQVAPSVGQAVVQVLEFNGYANEALSYAYALLRRHFASHEAHLAFMYLLLPLGPLPDIPQPESVQPGTAVCYCEEGESSESWIVIEDSNDPDLDRGEYPPTHDFSLRLLGKKKGDAVDIAVGAVSIRKGTVKDIVSKYVFRFRDCMNNWQIRFPKIPAVESVKVVKQVGEGQVHDFSALEKAVRLRHETTQQLLDAYRVSALPMNFFADRLQLSIYELVASFAGDPDVDIRCCLGSVEEQKTGIESLSTCTTLVMDATALCTMTLLGATEWLARWPIPIVLSHATLSAFRELVAKQERSPTDGGYLVKHGTGFALVEKDPEVERSRVNRLSAILGLVEQHCRILPCREVAALAPDKRRLLTEVFGAHGVESMMLASQPGYVLWSDDFSVSGLAKTEFAVRRVWTQLALAWTVKQGSLSESDFFTASAKLAGWGYSFTGLSVPILVSSGTLANWDVDRWPLKAALDRFRGSDLSTQDAAVLSSGLTRAIYRECSLPEIRQAVIIRMLERLVTRADGALIIGAIENAIPRLFGVDVVGGREALLVFRGWRGSRTLRPPS